MRAREAKPGEGNCYNKAEGYTLWQMMVAIQDVVMTGRLLTAIVASYYVG